MIFSTTSFDFKTLKDFKFFTKATLYSFFLNYVIFGIILLSLAYFLIDEKELFWGFVVIAATPPGVAIIPFTYIFKGNSNYSLVGVLGVYLISILITPLIIRIFISDANINIFKLIKITIEIIVIPILLSRLLIIKRIKHTVDKIKGKVVNWGFALIVYIVIGLNKEVIFDDLDLMIKLSFIFIVSILLLGFLHEFIFRKKIRKDLRVSKNLILTIKSSGFAAGTSLSILGERSALPSAFLAIFVLFYLILIGFVYDNKNTQNTK